MSNKEAPKRIYIDVTQAQNWQGRAAGIIRVMDEISSRFASDQRFKPTFISWDQKNSHFYEVDFLEALRAREHNLSLGQNKFSAEAESKSVIRKILLKVPLTKRIFHLIRNILLKVLSLPGVWRLTKKLELDKDSVLFMPHGGVWESEDYSKTILTLQKERGVSLIPILYDMCPVLTPQFCSPGIRKVFKQHMQKTLSSSDLILSISKNTSRDAGLWLKQVKASVPETREFRLGDEISDVQGTEPEENLPKEFIVYVSTIESRKNHTALYYAYKLAHNQNIKLPSIVIAGRKGWLANDVYEIIKNDPDVSSKFVFLHNASDQNLTWLYNNCLFLAYPSFYEGWGLPIAESLLHGTPVIASETSSIPEIGGNLVDYFSPYSPDEIMQKIQQYSNHRDLLETKRQKILKEYKATTWEDSYREVAEAILTL